MGRQATHAWRSKRARFCGVVEHASRPQGRAGWPPSALSERAMPPWNIPKWHVQFARRSADPQGTKTRPPAGPEDAGNVDDAGGRAGLLGRAIHAARIDTVATVGELAAAGVAIRRRIFAAQESARCPGDSKGAASKTADHAGRGSGTLDLGIVADADVTGSRAWADDETIVAAVHAAARVALTLKLDAVTLNGALRATLARARELAIPPGPTRASIGGSTLLEDHPVVLVVPTGEGNDRARKHQNKPGKPA